MLHVVIMCFRVIAKPTPPEPFVNVRRDAVQAPVDENADLAIVKPLGQWSAVDALPVGVILAADQKGSQENKTCNGHKMRLHFVSWSRLLLSNWNGAYALRDMFYF